MSAKKLIISLVVIALAIAGFFFIVKPFLPKKAIQSASLKMKTKAQQQQPLVKKTFSKDMGGLTVKILNSKNKEMSLRVRAFRAEGSGSSTYMASFTANRMQELPPGGYDIEVDTIPQKIYKNIKIANAAETMEDLGHITGAVNVKALNPKKKDAYYPIKIMYPKSSFVTTSGATNRPVEVIAGSYDIDIGTIPSQSKKNVKIEAGKETVLDIGLVTGYLVIKAVDNNNKEVRYSLRVKKAQNNEIVAGGATNSPVEILQGTYNVELLSNPVQIKKDLMVKAGEETVAEFNVQPPPPKVTAPTKPKK